MINRPISSVKTTQQETTGKYEIAFTAIFATNCAGVGQLRSRAAWISALTNMPVLN